MAFFFYKGHDLEVIQAIFLVDKLGQDIMPPKKSFTLIQFKFFK